MPPNPKWAAPAGRPLLLTKPWWERRIPALVPYILAGLVALPMLAYDASLALERSRAIHHVRWHGESPCLALVDPDIHAYRHRPELALLAAADPQGAAYFRSHHVSVAELDGTRYSGCFQPGRWHLAPGRSQNPVGTDAIFLNLRVLPTPQLRTVAISHELVHIQHSDARPVRGRHSWLRHLWMTEEGEAHLRGLRTAQRLNVNPGSRAWDYILFIYTLPISYVVFILLFCAAWLFAPKFKRPPKDKEVDHAVSHR